MTSGKQTVLKRQLCPRQQTRHRILSWPAEVTQPDRQSNDSYHLKKAIQLQMSHSPPVSEFPL